MGRSSLRAAIVGVIVVALALGAVFGYKALQDRRASAAQAHRGAPAVTVSTAPVRSVAWQREIHAVATLVAPQSVHLTTQLAGEVTGIYFRSGQYVKQGARLVQLDNSNQLAQLASSRAAVELAQANYDREERLLRTHAASEADLQSAHAAYEQATAAVANVQATLAKLALTAPFSGWIGLREASLGQYLSPGTGIATLAIRDPLRVQFTVPQSDLALVRVGQSVSLRIDAFPSQEFHATVSALGSEVDSATRNIGVEARLSNLHDVLRPGMFGTVSLLVGAPEQVLAVPSEAITYNTYGDFVYLVETRHGTPTAVATPVHSGESRDGLTEIEKGLRAGEEVVSAGQVKLHDGATVRVVRTGN